MEVQNKAVLKQVSANEKDKIDTPDFLASSSWACGGFVWSSVKVGFILMDV